jgi:enoyl-CoA hydratase/carnithine racemase
MPMVPGPPRRHARRPRADSTSTGRLRYRFGLFMQRGTPMTTLVEVLHGGNGVMQVVLNRPDKLNALTVESVSALVEAGESLGRSPRVRAVVLRGAGRAFCAGIDVTRFEALRNDPRAQPGRLGERTHGRSNLFQRAATVWADLPVPVIAALHGATFGGGLQIALGADIRLAAPDTKLAVMETKWGLLPDMGGMVLARRLLRGDVLRELTYTARIVEATEAVAIGLVTRVCDDPTAEALALAAAIATKSPRAIRAAKRLLTMADECDAATVLQAESDEQERLLGSAEQIETVRAHAERRSPHYPDPV